MKRPALSVGWLLAGLVVFPTCAGAQSGSQSTRHISVEGKAMRVWTAGLETRTPGQPVIVLESGAGVGLDHWKPIFTQMAALAPVFGYDRRGLGGSEVDSVPQTLERVATTLHSLLRDARVPPPYVLVGASWGGAFTRTFGTLFPTEVAGFVHLDVTDIDATRAELSQLPDRGDGGRLQPSSDSYRRAAWPSGGNADPSLQRSTTSSRNCGPFALRPTCPSRSSLLEPRAGMG